MADTGADQGQLAEGVAWAEDPQGRGLPGIGGDPDGHPAVLDQVQAVAGVPIVEDDLASREAPGSCCGEHLFPYRRRDW